LKHRYQQPFISFPDAKTPLFSIFHFFPPPPFSHYFSLPKQLHPALVSTFFSVAETPLSVTLHFLTLHHRQNNLFQQLFRLFPLLKHHLPTTLHHSFTMLKHHRLALFDFLPILKHQLSAVLHLQQLLRSSLLLKHPPSTIVRQQASTLSNISLNSRPST
jgi:hypothetical protein